MHILSDITTVVIDVTIITALPALTALWIADYRRKSRKGR